MNRPHLHSLVAALALVTACSTDVTGDETPDPASAQATGSAGAGGTGAGGAGAGGAGGSSGGAAPTASPTPAPLGAPYPVVLVHGMGGFEQLTVGALEMPYWNGAVEALEEDGEHEVFVTTAPAFATSEVRARVVAAQIDAILAKTGRAKVNVVGHSQGGLDARVLVSPAGLAYGDRVASVTTIATPHRGSRVADLVLRLAGFTPDRVIDGVTDAVLGAVQDLAYAAKDDPAVREQITQISEAYMTSTFNPRYVDDARVAYASFAGRTNLKAGRGFCDGATYPNEPSKVDLAQPLLYPTAEFLEGVRGTPNDGLVTVESSRWGEFLRCVPADHLKEVGLLNVNGATAARFDHRRFVRDIVAHLRARGH